MKEIINNIYWEAKNQLHNLNVSEMKLSERISYEKAVLNLDIMKKLIDKTIK